jgi:hypothetical protein
MSPCSLIPGWLGDATKAIGQHWRRKNLRRNGVPEEKLADDKPAVWAKGKAKEQGGEQIA